MAPERRRVVWSVVLIVAALLAWPALAAPARPGDAAAGDPALAPVSGLVFDLATGEPVAGAAVSAAGLTIRTAAGGRFSLSLPPGRFPLRVAAPGYSGATVVDVALLQDLSAAAPLAIGLPPLAAGEAAGRAMALRLKAAVAAEDSLLRRRYESVASGGRPSPLSPLTLLTMTAVPAPVTDVPRQIRVLMPDGQIVAMDTDEYLKGVVPAEMGYIFRRAMEALKAQAIASRTYAATGCLAASAGDPAVCEPGLDANVDTTTRTQVWRPVHYDLTDALVEATHGQVARRGAALIRALFFAHTVSATLNSELSPCCGGTATSYLRGVASPDPFDARFGHGAGLSQEGAAVLASWGATADEVIRHYYTGVHVEPTSAPRVYDVLVSPREAFEGDAITFQASYADADDDPPAEALVLVDGTPRPLGGPFDEATDYRAGATYLLTTTLALGRHRLGFRFTDGFSAPVEVDAGALDVRPLPAGAAVRPAEAAAPSEPAPGAAPSDGIQQGETVFRPDQLVPMAAAGTAPRPEAVRPGGLLPLQPDGSALGAIVQTPVATSTFGFMALGLEWEGREPAGGRLAVWLRTSRDGATWSGWLPAGADDADAKAAPSGSVWTGLVIARGRYAQARIALAGAGPDGVRRPVHLHFFNTDAGPFASGAYAAAVAARPSVRSAVPVEPGVAVAGEADGALAAEAADPTIIPRSGWGADERLRFNAGGQEIWPPEYTTPRAQIVHHTVTINDPADPAAIMRSVYQYHAVAREWGDIGYNFLIDHRGRIYEGRFGGERAGQIVQGGHALQFNANTIGVALLGTFTDAATQPSAAAENALVELLASRGVRFRIAPDAPVELVGTRFAYAVMGHRDALPGHTACPGDGAFARLAAVRRAVAARMAELGSAPSPAPTAMPSRVPATPRPSTPPTATPPGPPTVAPVCRNLVVGGDFEVESDRWIRNRAVYTRWDVYNGGQAVFLGLTNADADQGTTYASAEQVIRLPARLVSAKLRFAARAVGDETDRRLVRLLAGGGAVLGTMTTPIPATSPWRVYEEDVTRALVGRADQSVRLYFAVVNNGDGRKSYMRLDDVSLTLCTDFGSSDLPTAETPAAPSETSSPQPSATTSPTTIMPATPTPATPEPEAPTATATVESPPGESPTSAPPPASGTPPGESPTSAPPPASDTPPGESPTSAPPPASDTPPGESPTSAPPTASQPPPAVVCADMLSDGAFESDGRSPWLASGNQPGVRVATADEASGLSLRLGLADSTADGFGYAAAAQRLVLPSGAVSATLGLRYRLARRGADDGFVVEVRRLADGMRQLQVGPRLTAPLGEWQAVRRVLDPGLLAAGAGRLHEVYLAVLNRAEADAPGDVTAVDVDDVSLEVCVRPAARYFPISRR